MKSFKRQPSVLTLLLMLALTIQSCNNSEKKDKLSDQDDIARINSNFEEAYKRKDGEAIQALYTESGTLIAPYGTYEGNKEVKASFERDFSTHQSISKADLGIESIEYESDTLIVKGRFHILGVKVENGLPFELEGPYTHKCIKENGEWKISITSFTADLNINDY